ncbi:hypothetical protein ACFW2V_13020 [Streptomyces sp. NPDC058947]|uniref:hypothetical protein n=1 Tax=Streptomyces sp. NPDC058947 TaxID=3346675 RepID=UPI0036985C18
MDEPLSDELVTEGPVDGNPNSDEGAAPEGPTVQPAQRKHERSIGSQLDELLMVACTPGLSHGAFRLYLILAIAAHKEGSRDRFFPITLNGIQRVHPGTSGKPVGVSTIFKQIAELRAMDLLDMRAALHRNEPDLPVLVKVLYPRAGATWKGRKSSLLWEATDGSWLNVASVVEALDMQ